MSSKPGRWRGSGSALQRIVAGMRFEPKGSPTSRRRFDYDRRLLPNPRLVELEPGDPTDPDLATERTGLTAGYPAWNLLYYALLCSIPPDREDVVVVETGTNLGISTIVMAQALKDLELDARVETVDIVQDCVDVARENVRAAGLEDRVSFHVDDSASFLSSLVERVDHIDFAFLDAYHEFDFVRREIDTIAETVSARDGKIYMDNAAQGGVRRALRYLQDTYGGNVVTFENCSWNPPGNAIWQPARVAPASRRSEVS